MLLFWIAGFLFTLGFLYDCVSIGSKRCYTSSNISQGAKLFFIWPYKLGIYFSQKNQVEKHDNDVEKANQNRHPQQEPTSQVEVKAGINRQDS